MRRAKAAGIGVAFNHGGVAVLLMPNEQQLPLVPPEAPTPSTSAAPDK